MRAWRSVWIPEQREGVSHRRSPWCDLQTGRAQKNQLSRRVTSAGSLHEQAPSLWTLCHSMCCFTGAKEAQEPFHIHLWSQNIWARGCITAPTQDEIMALRDVAINFRKQGATLSQISASNKLKSFDCCEGSGGKSHTIIFGLLSQLKRRAERQVLNPEHALQIPPEVAANPIVIQHNSKVKSCCEWNGVFKDESLVGAHFSPRCTAALCSIYSSLFSAFNTHRWRLSPLAQGQ